MKDTQNQQHKMYQTIAQHLSKSLRHVGDGCVGVGEEQCDFVLSLTYQNRQIEQSH